MLDNLQNLIKQLDQENTRKYEFLNKEIVKLKINYPKDLSPKLIELEKKIDDLLDDNNESFFGRIVEEPDQD